MGLDIAGFRALFNSVGYAVQNRYEVRIPTSILANRSTQIYQANAAKLEFSDEATDWIADYFGDDPGAMGLELQAFCEKTELPSYQFQMETQRHYGPLFKIPHMPEYQDITMTFLCDQKMLTRYFFDSWMYMVMDPETNNFNYIDEYALDIDIVQFPDVADNTAANVVASIVNQATNSLSNFVGAVHNGTTQTLTVSPNYLTTLIDAFPIAVAAQELAYDANNTIQKLSVTFTYKYAVPFTGKGSITGRSVRNSVGQGYSTTFSNTITPPTAPEATQPPTP
jgi:hypothetical protein